MILSDLKLHNGLKVDQAGVQTTLASTYRTQKNWTGILFIFEVLIRSRAYFLDTGTVSELPVRYMSSHTVLDTGIKWATWERKGISQ